MADTYTSFLNLTRPEIGASRDSWGEKWNQNAGTLDNWAKATDALAKDALAKSGIKKRDAQNNEYFEEQTVQGPVRATGHVSTGGNFYAPLNNRIFAGDAYLWDTATSTDVVAGKSNVFRVVNYQFNTEVINANMNDIRYKGNLVWHAGNITPTNYFDRTASGRQELNGPFSINMANPYIDLTYGGVIRLRQIVDGNGTYTIRNGDNADSFFSVNTGGGVWTKQLGDLYTWIEGRAKAWADDAVGRAGASENTKLAALAANYWTRTADLEIQKADAALWLHYGGVKKARLYMGSDGVLRYQDSGGQIHLHVAGDGGVWTQQFGDLNGRIETRARDFADDRLNTAKAYADAAVSSYRNNDQTVSGRYTFTREWPTIALQWPNYRQWLIQVRNDSARLHFWDDSAGRSQASIGIDGSIQTAQFGDLNSRIEARASAFASDARNNAGVDTDNKFNAFRANAQRFTNQLELYYNYPTVRLHYPNVVWWDMHAREDGLWTLWANGEQDKAFTVRRDGVVWTRQFGDLNNRIEARAAAYASDARAGVWNDVNNNFMKRSGDVVNGNYYIGGTVGSNLEIYVDGTDRDPYFRLWRNNVGSRGLQLIASGELRLTNPDGGGSHYFRQNGSVYSPQFGDLNDRIENRAAAFADDRLNSARSYTDNAFNSFRSNSQTFTAEPYVTKAYPSVHLLYPGVRDMGWQVRENGRLYMWDWTAQNWQVNIGTNGEFETRQLGDLNNRIENRARDFADDRLNSARSYADGIRNDITGNYWIRTADMEIQKGNPGLVLHFGGVKKATFWMGNDGALRWTDQGGQEHFRIGGGGDLWLQQFGDLNSRIENRASAYANDARNNARADAAYDAAQKYFPRWNNDRVEMNSRPVVSGEWPYYEMVWGGKIRWQIRIGDNSELQFVNGDSGAVWHAFRSDGTQYSSNYGNIHDFVRNTVNAKTARLAFAGDVGTDWKNDGAFNEPFFGGMCTGVRQAGNQINGHRWRYLQMCDWAGNWYTCSFA